MAAAATTGPASGPRPASSMPMTCMVGFERRIWVSLVRGTAGVTFSWFVGGFRCCLGCTVLFLFFRLEEDFDAAVASVVFGVVVAFGSDSLLAAFGSSGMVEDSRAASACKRGLLLRSNSKPLELTIVPPTATVMMV